MRAYCADGSATFAISVQSASACAGLGVSRPLDGGGAGCGLLARSYAFSCSSGLRSVGPTMATIHDRSAAFRLAPGVLTHPIPMRISRASGFTTSRTSGSLTISLRSCFRCEPQHVPLGLFLSGLGLVAASSFRSRARKIRAFAITVFIPLAAPDRRMSIPGKYERASGMPPSHRQCGSDGGPISAPRHYAGLPGTCWSGLRWYPALRPSVLLGTRRTPRGRGASVPGSDNDGRAGVYCIVSF